MQSSQLLGLYPDHRPSKGTTFLQEQWISNRCHIPALLLSYPLYVRVEEDVVDAEVEGAEAVLPHGTVGGEVPADCAEEAGHSGAGGRGVEALEHGLGGAVRGVAGGHAVREEGVDVLVLAR